MPIVSPLRYDTSEPWSVSNWPLINLYPVIQALGEQLKVKQQVIATAIVYLKRFYLRNSFKCIDPMLMAPTCIFLASKVEEFGVISNNRLISTCQNVGRSQKLISASWISIVLTSLPPFDISVKTKYTHIYPNGEYPYRINHVLECEFYLLEMMDCCLILYHAYRPLVHYVQDWTNKDQILQTAW